MTVKEIRKALKISQSKLAGKLEVETQTVSAWETGRFTPNELNQLKLQELEKQIVRIGL